MVLLTTLVAAAFAVPSSPIEVSDPPTVNYLILTNTRDKVSCRGGGLLYEMYFETTGSCFFFPDLPTMFTALPGATANRSTVQTGSESHFSFELSDAGVSFTFYSDSNCRTQVGATGNAPYGSCLQPEGWSYSVTVDVAQYLPSPQAGHMLYKSWWKQQSCTGGTQGMYVLFPTNCFNFNGASFSSPDYEAFCGEGTISSSLMTWVVYGSRDLTCAGTPHPFETSTVSACTHLGNPGDTNEFAMRLVWCGGGCHTWKTLRARFPICDAPDAGTGHGVDLSKVLGPRCTHDGEGTDEVGAGQCCYLPLGYDGGPAYGTDCGRACRMYGRFGQTNEYCGASTGRFGNCFCGPQVVIAPPRHHHSGPPPPPPSH